MLHTTHCAPHRRTYRSLHVGLLLFALCCSGIVHAAASGSAAIESARQKLATATLDDAQRQLASADLDAAAADEAAADAFARELSKLKSETASFPARMQQLQRAMELDREQTLAEWSARLPKNADAETLERVLAQERSIISSLNAQIDAVGNELAQLISGPAQAAGDIATLRRRVDELAVAAPRLEDEPAVLAEIRQARRASELRRTQTELDLRLLEQESATRRQRLYQLTINELRFRQDLHVKRTELLQAEITASGRRQLEALIARLQQEEQALAGSTGVLAEAVADNGALGRELARQTELLAQDRLELAANEQARDRTSAALRDSQARLDLGGTTEQVGRWLWGERRRLEQPARLQQRLDAVRSQLADARVQYVTIEEDLRELINIPAAARELADTSVGLTDEEGVEVTDSKALEPVLTERVELLQQLQPQLERRIAALEQSEQAIQALTDGSRTLQQLLDRHLLWIASHRPVDASWLSRIPAGIEDLFKFDRLETSFALIRLHARENPLQWGGSLLLLLALLELRRRAPARIEAQAAITRQIRRDNYKATARALGWTLLGALPAPTAIYLLGNLVQQAGEPGRFTDSVGRALVMLTVPLFGLQLLRWISIERGLGHAHFRWLRIRREALRRWLPGVGAIVLPLYFVSVLAYIRNLDLPNDVQSRIAIVLICITLAWTCWRLLAAGRIWIVRGAEVEPSMLRKAFRIALPVLLLYVAGLAVTGYVYSAVVLLNARPRHLHGHGRRDGHRRSARALVPARRAPTPVASTRGAPRRRSGGRSALPATRAIPYPSPTRISRSNRSTHRPAGCCARCGSH
jgi:potassium-dependent mechanosensitive channel